MIVRPINGKRYISMGDVAHVMPHGREGTHAFVTIILDGGELADGRGSERNAAVRDHVNIVAEL